MPIREIVLDTETTGREVDEGHRLVEIGCVELINHLPTAGDKGNLHLYINPEREVEEGAFRVHGLSTEWLSKKPVFAELVDQFLDFIGDDPLIIHNAAFDMAFINAELERCGFAPLPFSRAIDTLAIARKKFPGAPASLDALCRRFGVDNSDRTLHGALLDSELLAEVYLQLIGGRQPDLVLLDQGGSAEGAGVLKRADYSARTPRVVAPTDDELAAHRAFLDSRVKGALWADGQDSETTH